MTVAELQMLLEKSEAKLVDRDRQIARLEEYIKNDLKAKLPIGNTPEATAEVSIDEAED